VGIAFSVQEHVRFVRRLTVRGKRVASVSTGNDLARTRWITNACLVKMQAILDNELYYALLAFAAYKLVYRHAFL